MSGEDVLRTYRSRFQIEFCYRDAKQFTGLTHCQGRHENQLDFSYNASFTALNVAKVMMHENGMAYSMASFKELMSSHFLAERLFERSGEKPNSHFISQIIEKFLCLKAKAA